MPFGWIGPAPDAGGHVGETRYAAASADDAAGDGGRQRFVNINMELGAVPIIMTDINAPISQIGQGRVRSAAAGEQLPQVPIRGRFIS